VSTPSAPPPFHTVARALVLTRAGVDSGKFDARERALLAAGVELRRFALIHIVAPADASPARRCLQRLADYALALPVSPNAVRGAFALLDAPWPASCAIGVVGPGSAAAVRAALAAQGMAAEALPTLLQAPAQQAESEGLWPLLQAWRPQGWRGARVLLLRGGAGREWLSERLREAGAEVDAVDVYRRIGPAADAATVQRLRELLAGDAVWLFSAAEALRHLLELLRAAGLDAASTLRARAALATHARIAEAARAAGFGRVCVCGGDAANLEAALRQL
jgi:uroporphyrinogen-III synthase